MSYSCYAVAGGKHACDKLSVEKGSQLSCDAHG